MVKPRKICIVITARPSYSRIKTAIKEIADHPNLDLSLIVAGPALLKRYGNVVDFIESDGFSIDYKLSTMIEGENLLSSTKSVGLGIVELSAAFAEIKPDAVVTIADRFETMATAVCAAYMNIPLAHIQGGEVTGNIDEKVRHSITKLADYHFVATDDAYERVVKLGENFKYVFNTGCPSIDIAKNIMDNPILDFDPYAKYNGVGSFPDFSNGYWGRMAKILNW